MTKLCPVMCIDKHPVHQRMMKFEITSCKMNLVFVDISLDTNCSLEYDKE